MRADPRALLKARTDELSQRMGIADQQVDMTTSQKLADMATRLGRLSSPVARNMVEKCLQMQTMAARYGL